MANVIVEVRTLRSGKHSGQYGGAAPDALLALIARDRHACTTNAATSPSPDCDATNGTVPTQSEEQFRELGEGARRACR